MSNKKFDLDQSFWHILLMTLTPEQCRAARAWLNWSQTELSQKASVGLSTVKSFEGGARIPISNNLNAIQRVLNEAGINLIFDDRGIASGICFKPAS